MWNQKTTDTTTVDIILHNHVQGTKVAGTLMVATEVTDAAYSEADTRHKGAEVNITRIKIALTQAESARPQLLDTKKLPSLRIDVGIRKNTNDF